MNLGRSDLRGATYWNAGLCDAIGEDRVLACLDESFDLDSSLASRHDELVRVRYEGLHLAGRHGPAFSPVTLGADPALHLRERLRAPRQPVFQDLALRRRGHSPMRCATKTIAWRMR